MKYKVYHDTKFVHLALYDSNFSVIFRKFVHGVFKRENKFSVVFSRKFTRPRSAKYFNGIL